jgi:hypothetical protein
MRPDVVTFTPMVSVGRRRIGRGMEARRTEMLLFGRRAGSGRGAVVDPDQNRKH